MAERTPLSHTLAGVLSRVQQGERGTDPELAAQLSRAFAKHEGAIRKLCRRELWGLPEPVVEETVQDVLLEAWNKIGEYRPERPFRVFLFAIASFKCRGVRRKRRDVLSEDGLVEVADEQASVLSRLADEERDALVEQAAKNVLDDREQEIAHLRWVLDYSYEQIGEHAGLATLNDVRAALVRCKRKLEKEIPRLVAERGHGDSFLRRG